MGCSLIPSCVLVLLAPLLACGQVVFSKRIYTEHGRSYHQLWLWNADTDSARALTASARNHFRPSCRAGSTVIYFYAGDKPDDERDLWSFDRANAQERRVLRRSATPPAKRVPVVGCEISAWVADQSRAACSVGQDIVFYDAAQAAISGRVRFTARSTTPEVIAWSDDAKWLLVRTMPSDYFVLNTETNTWTTAGSGNDALWVPNRNLVLYSSPREFSINKVWTSQLVLFDPATGTRREITRGIAYNIQPSVCR